MFNVIVWNKVSTDCVHATSVMFKNRIYKYIVKAVTLRIRADYTYTTNNSMGRLSIS